MQTTEVYFSCGSAEASAPLGHSGSRALEFLVARRQWEGHSTALPHFRMTHEPLTAHPADRATGSHLRARGWEHVEACLGGSGLCASDHVPANASGPAFLPSTHLHKHRIRDPQGIRPRRPLSLQMGKPRPRGLMVGSGCASSPHDPLPKLLSRPAVTLQGDPPLWALLVCELAPSPLSFLSQYSPPLVRRNFQMSFFL